MKYTRFFSVVFIFSTFLLLAPTVANAACLVTVVVTPAGNGGEDLITNQFSVSVGGSYTVSGIGNKKTDSCEGVGNFVCTVGPIWTSTTHQYGCANTTVIPPTAGNRCQIIGGAGVANGQQGAGYARDARSCSDSRVSATCNDGDWVPDYGGLYENCVQPIQQMCNWNRYSVQGDTTDSFAVGESVSLSQYPPQSSWSCSGQGGAYCSPSAPSGNGGYWVTCLTGAPTATTGSINTSANIGSASWTITGPVSVTGSGLSQSLTSQPAGTYTITFDAVSGYITPASQSFTITNQGDVISFSGTYVAIPTVEVHFQ